jgi:hypothetical protein
MLTTNLFYGHFVRYNGIECKLAMRRLTGLPRNSQVKSCSGKRLYTMVQEITSCNRQQSNVEYIRQQDKKATSSFTCLLAIRLSANFYSASQLFVST